MATSLSKLPSAATAVRRGPSDTTADEATQLKRLTSNELAARNNLLLFKVETNNKGEEALWQV